MFNLEQQVSMQFVGHLCNAGLKIEWKKEYSNISSYISDGKGRLGHRYIKNCTTEVTKWAPFSSQSNLSAIWNEKGTNHHQRSISPGPGYRRFPGFFCFVLTCNFKEVEGHRLKSHTNQDQTSDDQKTKEDLKIPMHRLFYFLIVIFRKLFIT